MKLFGGNAFSKVKKLSTKSTFSVSTPSSVCGVRGTAFGVGYKATPSEIEFNQKQREFEKMKETPEFDAKKMEAELKK